MNHDISYRSRFLGLFTIEIGFRDWFPRLVSEIGFRDWFPRLVSEIGYRDFSPMRVIGPFIFLNYLRKKMSLIGFLFVCFYINLSFIISNTSSFWSIIIHFLPNFLHALPVVPEPHIGSNTTPPSPLPISIILSNKLILFTKKLI